MSESFDQHCVVELMGHSQIAGKVTEATIGGASFIRVDVPKTRKRPAYTKFFGSNAIYAITPVEDKVAQAMAEMIDQPPIEEYRLRTIESWTDEPRRLPPVRIPLEDEDDAERRKHLIVQVERYISRSGNDTWKAFDEDGAIIYLRQSDRAMLTESGLWDQLNRMPTGATWDAKIILTTIKDGDFFKPIRIDTGGKVFDRTGRQVEARQQAAEWADKLRRGSFVVFDVETTGTDDQAQVIQVAVVASDGQVLMDQLVKPSVPITNSELHGITDDDVKDAPDFAVIYDDLKDALDGRPALAFNYDFDALKLAQECQRANLDPLLGIPGAPESCVMKMFARFNGEWKASKQDWTWKSLDEAVAHFKLTFPGRPHNAVADCRAALAVIEQMAAEFLPF